MTMIRNSVAGVLFGAILTGPLAAVAGSDNSHRTPAADVEWIQTPFGPLASPVVGDFTAGQHVTFVKFAAGTKTETHTHSNDYTGFVISGVTRHYVSGKPKTETDLPAGSHWFIPANLTHISACMPGEDCVMALFQTDAFDFLPAK